MEKLDRDQNAQFWGLPSPGSAPGVTHLIFPGVPYHVAYPMLHLMLPATDPGFSWGGRKLPKLVG